MRTTMAVMAVATGSLMVASACGGSDGDDSVATGGDDATSTTGAGAGADGGEASTCLLDAAAVGEVAGEPVMFDELSVGAAGAGSGEASFGPDGAESSSDVGYSLAWNGCRFTSDDDAEYMVGELVDDNGEADGSGLVHLLDQLTDPEEGIAAPDVGDEAFVDEDQQLVVRAGDSTLVIGFERGSNPSAGDMATLNDIATSLVDGGLGDMVAMCETAAGMALEAWGPVGQPLIGSGAGTIDGVEYSYESCSVSLLDGAAGLDLKLGDAHLYDLLLGVEAGPSVDDEDPQVVEGLGDGAVSWNGALYVLVGDRGVVASALGPDGEGVADDATVQALAQAAANALS